MTTWRPTVWGRALALVWVLGGVAAAQAPADDLRATLDRLGDFDYAVRTEASRALRRAPADVAVPLLRAAVRDHDDSYVQYRALVLLYGFGDPDTGRVFEAALASPNDRVRTAAYDYFAERPDARVAPMLLAALDRETSEFVRPALVRALATHDADAAVRARLVRDVDRGEGFFRAGVIETLGDRQAEYALEALARIALEPGPLQDDAVLALGKIGGAQAGMTIGAVQRDAPPDLQPIVSAAACLVDLDCANQRRYLIEALRYGAAVADGSSQALLRNAAAGLSALAVREDRTALDALFDTGAEADGPARAPIALALGTVALRAPAVMRAALEARATPEPDLLLLRDAFDMLDEDFAEEQFYVVMRGAYWEAAAGTSEHRVAQAALEVLEF